MAQLLLLLLLLLLLPGQLMIGGSFSCSCGGDVDFDCGCRATAVCKPHNGHDFEMAAAARPNATVEMQTVRCRDNNSNNNESNMSGHKGGNALIYGRKINNEQTVHKVE